MIPPLTEQWAATYLEILVGIITFALGIATLVLQLALPAYLHTLATRRQIWRNFALTIMGGLICTFLFLWFLHPTADHAITGRWAFLAHSILTVVLLGLVVFSVRQIRQVDSTSLVRSLKDECILDISTGDHQFDDTLDTLIDIGRQAEAGFEKQQVLDGLNQMADYLLGEGVSYYDGTTLMPVLIGFEAVLLQGNVPGSRDNFEETGKMFRQIISDIKKTDYNDGADVATLISVTMSMALTILDLRPRDTQLLYAFLEVLESVPSKAPFNEMHEIGVFALRAKNYDVMLRVFHDLQIFGGDDLLSNPELVGLLSHMWYHNKGTGRLVDHFLYAMEEGGEHLNEALNNAINYHFSTANFDTVDLLVKAQSDWVDGA